MQQHAEIQDDDGGDESFEQKKELALGDEIGFAGLVDEFGDLPHGPMNREVLEAPVDGQAKQQAKYAEKDSVEKQRMAIRAQETHLRQIWKFETSLAASSVRSRLGHGGRRACEKESGRYRECFRTATRQTGHAIHPP